MYGKIRQQKVLKALCGIQRHSKKGSERHMPNLNIKMLTVKETAQILKVSERTIIRLTQSKQLKAVKITKWLINEDDLKKYIESKSNMNK